MEVIDIDTALQNLFVFLFLVKCCNLANNRIEIDLGSSCEGVAIVYFIVDMGLETFADVFVKNLKKYRRILEKTNIAWENEVRYSQNGKYWLFEVIARPSPP